LVNSCSLTIFLEGDSFVVPKSGSTTALCAA
jgi:hypothetical protein